MNNERKSGYGACPTEESRGIDRGYEAVRETAKEELARTMTGPRHPLQPIAEDGIKNPEGEFEVPAPMPIAARETAGSNGNAASDPQGQQGGTEGGQPTTPPVSAPGRVPGTPLASAKERVERSTQRSGAGVHEQY